MRRNDFVGDSGVVERGTTLVPKKTLFTRGAACHDRGGCRWHRGALGLATRPRTRAHSMFFTLTLLAGAAAYQPATLPRHRDASSLSNLQMMAKKPKTDPRVWLPKRSSPYAREVDVALQLVCMRLRIACACGLLPPFHVDLWFRGFVALVHVAL